jgi:diketogulonate reductase-like aldo/keto reductase
VIQDSDHRWSQLKERYETLKKDAKASYESVETLVHYFEAEAIRIPAAQAIAQNPNSQHSITADYVKLLATFEELVEHVQNVEKIKENGLIDDLAIANSQYDHYEQLLLSCEYLGNITEDVIYAALSGAIRSDNSSAFENFTQLDRDSYLRLKLRGIYSFN